MFTHVPAARILSSSAILLTLLAAPLSAAEFLVTHGGDSGEGSLRRAILDANASPGLDRIESAILEIRPTSPLPPITDVTEMRIFGVIDGRGIPGEADGLVFTAASSADVQVRNFGGAGVILLDHTGSVLFGDISECGRGIEVIRGGRHEVIASVFDNDHEGLLVSDSDGNRIGQPSYEDCHITCAFEEFSSRRNGAGVRLTGDFNRLEVLVSENSGDGVVLDGFGNRIDGRVTANGGIGVRAHGVNEVLARISGNLVGELDLDGALPAVQMSASVYRDEEALYTRGGVFLAGEIAGPPHRRYRLEALAAGESCSDFEAVGQITVEADASGRAELRLSTAAFWEPPPRIALRISEEFALGEIRFHDTLAGPACSEIVAAGGPMSDLALEMTAPASVRQGETFLVEFLVRNEGPAPEPEATLYIEPHAGRVWYVNGIRASRSSNNGVVFPVGAGETVRIHGILQLEAADELRAAILETDADGSNNFDVERLQVLPWVSAEESVRLEIDPAESLGGGVARRQFRIINESIRGYGPSEWDLPRDTIAIGISSPHGVCSLGSIGIPFDARCRIEYIGAGETIEGTLLVLEPPRRRRAVGR